MRINQKECLDDLYSCGYREGRWAGFLWGMGFSVILIVVYVSAFVLL